jgi:subtilisin family serine protease
MMRENLAGLQHGTQSVGVAPDVAAFSSRGPALAGSGDLLKPDIMAPGVDVLAAYSPAGGGRNWDFLSGTSMSSPHMAGLAALMKDLHPDWTPAAIKSAFMTTASTIRNNATSIPDDPFGYGAGQVVPITLRIQAWSIWLVSTIGATSLKVKVYAICVLELVLQPLLMPAI